MGCGNGVGTDVGVFRQGITLLEGADGLDLLGMAGGEEQGAAVDIAGLIREAVDQRTGGAQASPGLGHAVNGPVHRSADSGIHQVGRAAPGFGADAVIGDREDDLRRGVSAMKR